MQKANDWLLAQGHITEIKRGRRSVENTALLAEAYANGTRFTDWEPAETVKEDGTKVIKNVSKTANGGSNIENYTQEFIRYDGGDARWIAREVDTNKERSLKEICRGCGYSVSGHICSDEFPLIVTNAHTNGVRVKVSMR